MGARIPGADLRRLFIDGDGSSALRPVSVLCGTMEKLGVLVLTGSQREKEGSGHDYRSRYPL
jgi:hypothetical protein